MISVKNILKSWLDDKPNCQRMEYFSKAKFDCLHSENDIIVGRFDYPGFHNCESFCGLLFKFEASIFKKNIVKVVLVGLPKNFGPPLRKDAKESRSMFITICCRIIPQTVYCGTSTL